MAKSKEKPPQPQEKPPEKTKDDSALGWLLLIGALLWTSSKRGRR